LHLEVDGVRAAFAYLMGIDIRPGTFDNQPGS
jgi:hypothetical protein